MTVTLATAAKNAACDAVVDLVDAGSGAGKMNIKTSGGTTLAVVTLSDPAFGAAAAGVATLQGTPLSSAAATSAGTADNFEVVDSDDNQVFTGSITESGGGGDAIIDSASVEIGDTINITAMTYAQP